MKTKSVKKNKPATRLKDLAAKKNPKAGYSNRRERDKLATNHNETLVRDSAPAEEAANDQGKQKVVLKDMAAKADVTGGMRRERAGRRGKAPASTHAPTTDVGGSCPPFACGADSNHNETLVRDEER